MKKYLFILMFVSVLVGRLHAAEMTILIDGALPANQGCVDFYRGLFPDATVIAGSYHNTADAGVQAEIEAADALVIARDNYSANYDTADGNYYAGLTKTVVIIHSSYFTRESRMKMESGGETGPSMADNETTVTAAGAAVLGVPAGNYDFNAANQANFWSCGNGTVGTGKILATIGGSNYVILWEAGDTDASGREIKGTILLFNIHQLYADTGNTNYIPPTTQAGADALTSAILYVLGAAPIRGAATDPDPDGETLVDSRTTTAVSWAAPVDPNLASISGYDVVFGTEPNMLLNPVYPVTTESLPVTLDYDTTYYWRVDTHVVWDSNEITGVFSETVTGNDWTFTTFPFDLVPVVTANNVLTSMPYLPAGLTGTIDDSGQEDIVSVVWEALGTTAVKEAKQMITRAQSLSEVMADPSLLMDWIGTDTREVGEPMYLSLKGLPAGTYNWKSYHHDAENQNGVFDVTVYDASGTAETTGIAYRNGNSLPVITVPLTITSNGTDDVVLAFDLQVGTFFVMNGFELDTTGGSGDPLYIDFGTVVSATDPNAVNVMPGYEAYTARHEVSETFTEQSYSAFGTTVSILPTWGGMTATVTDTTNDPVSASQSATFSADWPGAYRVRLSATDRTQTGSRILVVTVATDPCAAAQRSAFWTGFSAVDFNKDCVVNLDDFASLASQWLDDRKMTAQE